jgi:hypothetical protein
MKLMTKGLAEKLVKADKHFVETGETGNEVLVKYFTPWANATWYVVGATPLDEYGEVDYELGELNHADDWHMFGYCDLGLGPGMAELGYVMLGELEGLEGPFGLKVERDLYYDGKGLDEVMKEAA